MGFLYSQTAVADQHNFTDTFTKEYTSNQTSLKIITPSTGKRIQVTYVSFNTKATTGQVKIYDDKSAREVAILNAEGGGHGEFPMRFVGSLNSSLELTSTTGSNSLFVVVNYKEVDEATPLTTSTTTSTTTSSSTSSSTSTS